MTNEFLAPVALLRQVHLLQWALIAASLQWVTPAHAQTAQRFATVHRIAGSVQATNTMTGEARALQPGDAVNVGELVQAGPAGEAVLRTDDAGVLAVRPSAVFRVEEFRAKGDGQDAFTLRIQSGSMRVITGWTGIFNRDRVIVKTPTTFIGVRGTDHEPYVITKSLSLALQQPEGTYSMVTRGGTTLEAAGGAIGIAPGQVGFSAADGKQPLRSLLTVLMPSLLDKVPDFYVPGQFDDALEALAAQDLAQALRALSQRCVPGDIAAAWLAQLDASVRARDAEQFLALFAPQSRVKARVRTGSGNTATVEYSRDELAASTWTALRELTQFETARQPAQARIADTSNAVVCDRIDVVSLVTESGARKGTSYRLESVENYALALLEGRWVAIEASTEQR